MKDKIKKKSLNLCVLGLGYIGLPLSLSFAEKGWKVVGYDIDSTKIKKLTSKISTLRSIDNARIKNAIDKYSIKFTSLEKDINECKIYIICVPTPLGEHKEPNLDLVRKAISTVSKYLKEDDVICLESTTYPGTTEEIFDYYISPKGYKAGKDIFMIYSPEREDPGNKFYTTSNTPKVLGGITNECTEIGRQIYSSVIDKVVTVKDCKTAEMTKLLENIHRAVNIGLVNEIKPLADKMDIDIYEVIEAASTKPFGFVPYFPGPGLGGHCIPIDPFYLSWKAKEYGMNTKFIELAGEINSSMPNYVTSKVIEALNIREKHLKKSKILVIGLAYKKNIDDTRESPSIDIIKQLSKKEAIIDIYDPLIKEIPKDIQFHNCLNHISKENLKSYDAVLIITDHDIVDYEMIAKYSNLIIDTRGRLKTSNNVVRS